ncbi:RNA-binding protein [Lactobacillus kimbladii]|uniref:YlmH family RNA-binding protein n=1 Tax=Lactobacillus kimbladii TaxID=1218506 RepID=UPI003AF7751C
MKTKNIAKRSFYAKNVLFKDNLSDQKTVDKMNGLINNVLGKHEEVLTDFLDPGERDILKKIAQTEVCLQSFGGYANAEKKRVFITEDWDTIAPSSYQITVFNVEYPQKFACLSHSAILGSLANAGIETSTFGDIITDGNGRWQFFAKSELKDFFQHEINHIGKTKVRIRPSLNQKVIIIDDESEMLNAIVSSLRLDAVLASITHESRQQIKANISNNLVKLNWHSVKDFNIMVDEDDVLSLRHFGRCKITDISTTRKGKHKVVYKLWQTKRKNHRD